MPSYNAEKYIECAINSVVSQSTLPSEVIILDDYSLDETWNIICDFKKRYPLIIKNYRNEKNIGLYQNLNKLKKMPSGDIISFVAGDDMLDTDFITNINDFILKNKIDDFSKKFMIITNSIEIIDAEYSTYNNYIYKDYSVIKSALRGRLHIWDNGISSGLFYSMPDFVEDIGNHADSLQITKRISISEQIYFLDKIGYKYRKNVGVTVNTNRKVQTESYLTVLNLIKEDRELLLDIFDLNYLNFLIKYYTYILLPNKINYFAMLTARLRKLEMPIKSPYSKISIFIPFGVIKIIKNVLNGKVMVQ